MSEGFNLRIKYAKRGRLAYLSHLETIRSVERIIRRAQLPYAITEGFNPHMKIAFGPALPVGAAGLGEYADVRMREYVPAQLALQRMQQMAAPNLFPLACDYIDVRADAITVEYPISLWRAELVGASEAQLDAACRALLEIGHIEVVRKRKAPKLVEFEGRLVQPPAFEALEDRVGMRFSTRDVGKGALRPDKFIAAMLEQVQTDARVVKLERVELRQDTQ